MTAVILGVRMQAAQSSVGKVLSNIAMWPPMRRLALDEDDLFAGVGQGQGRLDAGDAAADDHRPRRNPHELPLQGLVSGDAADGAGQVGLGLHQRGGLVGGHPGDLLADVGHLHQEAVQAGVLGGAAEGGLVQVGRAGRHHDAVQPQLADVALDQLLAGIGAHVLVVPGQGDAGQTLGELGQGVDVDHAGDIGAAVADVDADPQRFIACNHALCSTTSGEIPIAS